MKNKIISFWRFMTSSEALLAILYTSFAAALITANVVASKLFATGVNLFGSPVAFNVGTFAYAITFLVSNIISHKYGPDKAKIAILGGFIAQFISTIMIVILRYLPATDPAMQNSYVMLIGQNWVFVVGSLTAYVVSQLVNTYVFNKLGNWFFKRRGDVKGIKGVWNVTSSVVGQLIDTAVFALIAFGLGFGWLWGGLGLALLNMIIGQWLAKCLIALIYTPIFYVATLRKKKSA